MLKIEKLSKSFGNKPVLQDLELEVQEGSIFGLVGVNGAGKSTLLRLIAGVYEPDTGHVCFNDQDTFCDMEIKSHIAFVSDDQYYPVGATIRNMKDFYSTLYPFYEEEYQKYLKMFNLDEKSNILNLSKGNKRRVSLLFALSTKPKLLLLDEAYDGLEPLIRYKFKKVLMDMIEEEGVSIIISSHNLKELEDICDSFGILEDGKMVSYGDLLQSKEQVNKYQVVFKEEKTKEDFSTLHILHFEAEGRVVKLVVKGDEEEVKATLQRMDPLLLDVLQVNFEELFIYELEGREDIHE